MKRGFLAAVLLIASSAYAGSTFKVLHSFHCDPSGCGPNGGLAFDAAGNLYGTTPGGGDADATIFRLAPSSGDHWTYSPLHTLTLSEGSSLDAALAVDPAGNLYGTSQDGGAHDWGSVFELSPDPAAVEGWTLRVLHSFYLNGKDGAEPWDKVTLDRAGNVYGTTREGVPMEQVSYSSSPQQSVVLGPKASFTPSLPRDTTASSPTLNLLKIGPAISTARHPAEASAMAMASSSN